MKSSYIHIFYVTHIHPLHPIKKLEYLLSFLKTFSQPFELYRQLLYTLFSSFLKVNMHI